MEEMQTNHGGSIGGRVRSGISWLLIAAALGIGGLMTLPTAFGLQRYVITGRSMTGTIDRGSIVFEKPVAVADLRVGDIVTYTPPAGSGPGGMVTHRIVWIGRGRDGGRVFRTKGDYNPVPDPWRFTLRHGMQPRVLFHVPYIGYAVAAFAIRKLRMLLIGLPAIAIGLALAVRLWRSADEEPDGEVAAA